MSQNQWYKCVRKETVKITMFTVNDVNDTPPHLHSQKNAVCGRPRKKPITRPYVNRCAPSWRRECRA